MGDLQGVVVRAHNNVRVFCTTELHTSMVKMVKFYIDLNTRKKLSTVETRKYSEALLLPSNPEPVVTT